MRKLAEDLTDGKADTFVSAAHAYALAAATVRPFNGEMLAQEKKRHQRYADLSLACLNDAIAAGYDKLDSLRDAPALKELRDLPKIRNLLKTLK